MRIQSLSQLPCFPHSHPKLAKRKGEDRLLQTLLSEVKARGRLVKLTLVPFSNAETTKRKEESFSFGFDENNESLHIVLSRGKGWM